MRKIVLQAWFFLESTGNRQLKGPILLLLLLLLFFFFFFFRPPGQEVRPVPKCLFLLLLLSFSPVSMGFAKAKIAKTHKYHEFGLKSMSKQNEIEVFISVESLSYLMPKQAPRQPDPTTQVARGEIRRERK